MRRSSSPDKAEERKLIDRFRPFWNIFPQYTASCSRWSSSQHHRRSPRSTRHTRHDPLSLPTQYVFETFPTSFSFSMAFFKLLFETILFLSLFRTILQFVFCSWQRAFLYRSRGYDVHEFATLLLQWYNFLRGQIHVSCQMTAFETFLPVQFLDNPIHGNNFEPFFQRGIPLWFETVVKSRGDCRVTWAWRPVVNYTRWCC